MQSRRTWTLLASLYSTQFLGLMFFVVAMVAILRDAGASLDTIGLIYLLGMTWPLKALWAPWIDRHATGLRGHYRGWLLLTQAGMVLCLAVIGMLDLRADFAAIYLLCLATALLSCTQDIALDGLACRLLGAAERGLGNGLQIAAGLIGNLVGGGVMLMLYPTLGWQGCCLVLAALTSVSWLQLLGYREARLAARRRTGQPPPAVHFLARRGAQALAAVAGAIPGRQLAGVRRHHAGVDRQRLDAGRHRPGGQRGGFGGRAGHRAGIRPAAAAHGAPARDAGGGGATAAGHRRPGLAGDGLGPPAAAGALVVLYFLLYTPAATVLATLMMDHASPESPATDYTVQASLSHFLSMGLSSVGAMLAGRIGYGGVIATSVALAALALVAAVRWTPREAA
ncbi:MFS transporter [Achromobacter insuavis]